MKISVVVPVPMRKQIMLSTILHCLETSLQAYFSSVALAACSVSPLIAKIKATHSLHIQEIQTGGQNIELVHNAWLLEKLVQASFHLSKVG